MPNGDGRLLLESDQGGFIELVRIPDTRISTPHFWNETTIFFLSTPGFMSPPDGLLSSIWSLEIETGIMTKASHDFPIAEGLVVITNSVFIVSRAPTPHAYLVLSEHDPTRTELYLVDGTGREEQLTEQEFLSAKDMVHQNGSIYFVGFFRRGPQDEKLDSLYQWNLSHGRLSQPLKISVSREAGAPDGVYNICKGPKGLTISSFSPGARATTKVLEYDIARHHVSLVAELPIGASVACPLEGGGFLYLDGRVGCCRFRELWISEDGANRQLLPKEISA